MNNKLKIVKSAGATGKKVTTHLVINGKFPLIKKITEKFGVKKRTFSQKDLFGLICLTSDDSQNISINLY
jgi:hypothetical protein